MIDQTNEVRGWHHRYTEEQLEVIRAEWPGRPPAQCTGKCKLSHFFAAGCSGCGWHEEIPVTGNNNEY